MTTNPKLRALFLSQTLDELARLHFELGCEPVAVPLLDDAKFFISVAELKQAVAHVSDELKKKTKGE